MSSSRVPSTMGRTRFTSTARATVPSIESTARLYAIHASAVRAAPRSAASTARIPAAALLAVNAWTPHAAARRTGPAGAVTRRSRRACPAFYCRARKAATTAASAATAHAAAAVHLGAAEPRRDGNRADFQVRAHHRRPRHREMRVADDHARLLRAGARAVQRDQRLIAPVAQPAREPPGAQRLAHGRVDHHAATVHE